MPVACSAQARGLLEPLGSTPASPDGYPGTAVWIQPSPASTSSICSLLQHDPWQWSRQGTRAVAGGFRTHEGSGPSTQTFAELLFPIMWEGPGSGLDLGGEGCALQVQTFAGDEARRRDK